MSRSFCPLAFAVGLLISLNSNSQLMAQESQPPYEEISIAIDSGWITTSQASRLNNGMIEIWRHDVSLGDVPWSRLHIGHFDVLPSSDRSVSHIEIISLTTGESQILNSQELARWHNRTAFFLGGDFTIVMRSIAGQVASRLVIDGCTVGRWQNSKLVASLGDCTDDYYWGICAGIDDRVSSSDPRVGKAWPLGNTVWLFENHANWLLTVSHACFNPDFLLNVIGFNFPSESFPDGTPKPPPLTDQYPIAEKNQSFPPYPLGSNDWCLVGVTQSLLGKLPLERQGASFALVKTVPFMGGNGVVRVTGYGEDRDPSLPGCPFLVSNRTLQTATGTYLGLDEGHDFVVDYLVDATTGNSGSAIEHECLGLAYGIAGLLSCSGGISPGWNRGTAIDDPNLQALLADPPNVTGVFSLIGDCDLDGVRDNCEISCLPSGCNGSGCGTEFDINGNDIPDSCEPDCNSNGFVDGYEIDQMTSNDINENGIPDECESPSVVGSGPRYLDVKAPSAAKCPVALRVIGSSSDSAISCVSKYIQANGNLGTTPVYRSVADWGTVRVTGSEIIPKPVSLANRTYCVEAESQDGWTSFTSCASTWRWGDVNNSGLVTLDDVLCALTLNISSCPGGDIAPSINPNCTPNRTIDIDDVLRTLNAFSGGVYACPNPCP